MSALQLEFADSEVAGVQRDGARLRLRFAAAQVSHPDPHGMGRAASHLAGLDLVCEGGPWPLADPGWVGRLAEGELVRDGRAWVRLPLSLPLPLLDPLAHPSLAAAPGRLPVDLGAGGPVRLALRFANGAVLGLQVTSLSFEWDADARFTESLAC